MAVLRAWVERAMRASDAAARLRRAPSRDEPWRLAMRHDAARACAWRRATPAEAGGKRKDLAMGSMGKTGRGAKGTKSRFPASPAAGQPC